MNPGLDTIIACPRCGGLARREIRFRGDLSDYVLWTDGKREWRDFAPPPLVAKCRHCADRYWIRDAAVKGELPHGAAGDSVDPERERLNLPRVAYPPVWRGADVVAAPDIEDLYDAIDRDVARDAGREIELRRLTWQRSNDAMRRRFDPLDRRLPPVDDRREANMHALVDLLGGSDEDLLCTAELQRELGAFDAALRALDRMTPGTFATLAAELRALIGNGDTVVRRFGRRRT